MVAPEGRERDEGIAAALELEGLEDTSSHFLPHHTPWLKDVRTWIMYRGGWKVHYWTDYILGT